MVGRAMLLLNCVVRPAGQEVAGALHHIEKGIRTASYVSGDHF